MTHEGLGLTVFIPRHRGTIPLGTVTDMVRRSGVTDEEFLAALNGNIPPRFRN
jgi:sulfur carrier protein ThiS